MRTSFQAALVFLLLTTSTYAQTPPAWVEVKPSGEGFMVSFPATPQHTVQEAPTNAGTFKIQTWMFEPSPDVAFMLGYTDFPPAVIDRTDSDTHLNGAVQGQLRPLPAGSAIKSETRIELAGFPGREVLFEMPDGIAKARLFLVGSRLYQLIALTTKGGAETVMPDMDRFLKSFALIAR